MKYISTRGPRGQNLQEPVDFSYALLNCLCADGGVYVPAYAEDLRPWIMYMDEIPPFSRLPERLLQPLLKKSSAPS